MAWILWLLTQSVQASALLTLGSNSMSSIHSLYLNVLLLFSLCTILFLLAWASYDTIEFRASPTLQISPQFPRISLFTIECLISCLDYRYLASGYLASSRGRLFSCPHAASPERRSSIPTSTRKRYSLSSHSYSANITIASIK